MRLVTYLHEGRPAVGVRSGDEVVPLPAPDMVTLIAQGKAGIDLARATASQAAGQVQTVRPDRVLAPLPRPGKILCAEVNYPSIMELEPQSALPDRPRFFAKLPSAVIGPDADIVIPRQQLTVDYEVELAFVVGRRASRILAEAAGDFIFGYTIINDVSARNLQLDQNDVLLGKGIDTFCPLGPEIVTADEISDPRSLRLRSFVNGQLRQDDSLGNLYFGIPQLLEALTAMVTLEPGDIVSTGTPAGIGLYLDPPQFLQPGDEVAVEVDQIGRLTNHVVAGWGTQ
jgi:2-keto-4-pentenoate hydratase/2-oxohepta-3-ene-1,7-dioic acid hydratase in catechol pathway